MVCVAGNGGANAAETGDLHSFSYLQRQHIRFALIFICFRIDWRCWSAPLPLPLSLPLCRAAPCCKKDKYKSKAEMSAESMDDDMAQEGRAGELGETQRTESHRS